MEKDFIQVLSEFASSRDRPNRKGERDVLNSTMSRINAKHGSAHNLDYVQTHFKKLRIRHEAYGAKFANPYIRFDSGNNMPRTNEMIWEYLMLKHPGVEPYYAMGEPNWIELCNIFGPPPPHQEINSYRLICISDDMHNTSTTRLNPNCMTISCSPGTSPVVQPSLGSSFWNNLDPILADGIDNSQDSVKNTALRCAPPKSAQIVMTCNTRVNAHATFAERQFDFGPFQPTPAAGLSR